MVAHPIAQTRAKPHPKRGGALVRPSARWLLLRRQSSRPLLIAETTKAAVSLSGVPSWRRPLEGAPQRANRLPIRIEKRECRPLHIGSIARPMSAYFWARFRLVLPGVSNVSGWQAAGTGRSPVSSTCVLSRPRQLVPLRAPRYSLFSFRKGVSWAFRCCSLASCNVVSSTRWKPSRASAPNRYRQRAWGIVVVMTSLRPFP